MKNIEVQWEQHEAGEVPVRNMSQLAGEVPVRTMSQLAEEVSWELLMDFHPKTAARRDWKRYKAAMWRRGYRGATDEQLHDLLSAATKDVAPSGKREAVTARSKSCAGASQPEPLAPHRPAAAASPAQGNPGGGGTTQISPAACQGEIPHDRIAEGVKQTPLNQS